MTIKELLGKSPEEIASLPDAQVEEWFKDVLRPQQPETAKATVPKEDEEDDEPKNDKEEQKKEKKRKEKLSNAEMLAEAQRLLALYGKK